MSEYKIGNMSIRIPRAVNFMSVIVIVVLGVLYASYFEKNNNEILIKDLNASLELANTARENNEAAYISYKLKYEELLDKAWHSGEDLVAYIDAMYTNVPIEVAKAIADSINSVIDQHKMDFSLVVGLIEVESSFNPMAVSPKGALGLMQIMPNIWGDSLCIATEKEFYDIGTNILCGVQVFLHNLEMSDGDIHEALWRYNGTGGKEDEFANRVYNAVGRFEVFRAKINGEYESVEQEGPESIDQRLSGSESGIR